MEYTTTLTFDQFDDTTEAFRVRLASSDPSSDDYGIKDLTNSTTTVAWGTIVTEDSTGNYSYTFTIESGHIYNVSWEILVNDGEQPSYRTYQVGPFFSINNDNIRAVSTFSGKFTQGSFATLMLKITNFDGYPVDDENIYIDNYNK